ncbi:unnamed protein product [Urochloa humidicola]
MALDVARSWLPATVLLLAALHSAAAAGAGVDTGAVAALLEFKRALRDVDGRLSTWNAAAAGADDNPCGWAGTAAAR